MARILITSERHAWEAVLKYANRIQEPRVSDIARRESAIAIGAIAENMLQQLKDGIHANPARRSLGDVLYEAADAARKSGDAALAKRLDRERAKFLKAERTQLKQQIAGHRAAMARIAEEF